MASESDDIDAGWDDEPTRIQPALSSAARHSVPSLAPPTPVAFTARARGLAASSESLSPSTNTVVTVPRSLLPAAQAPFIVKLSAAAALAAVMGFTVRRATLPDAPTPATRAEAPAGPVEQVAAPARTGVPSTVSPPVGASPVSTAPAVPAPIPTVNATSLTTAAPASTAVRVKSIPEGAIFFEGGKRLGTSVIEVVLEPRAKRNFTALLNGYEPLNFKVDGTRSQLNVRLSRALPAEKKAPSEQGAGEAATSEPTTSEQQPEQ